MTYTDDDLSELEEFIDSCCREAVAMGFDLRWDNPGAADFIAGQHCPLAAVAFVTINPRAGWPCATDALRLPWRWGTDFGIGFDHLETYPAKDPHATAMGQRFRERVLAGEYTVTGATR